MGASAPGCREEEEKYRLVVENMGAVTVVVRWSDPPHTLMFAHHQVHPYSRGEWMLTEAHAGEGYLIVCRKHDEANLYSGELHEWFFSEPGLTFTLKVYP